MLHASANIVIFIMIFYLVNNDKLSVVAALSRASKTSQERGETKQLKKADKVVKFSRIYI